jgi:DNA-binding NarL/FixJ family response regulator
VRVVVADDELLTREGIARLLADAGVEVVAQAGDVATLMRHVESAPPDAAIVDIRMPPSHTDEGLVAARRIRAEHPDTAVLVLSHYVEPSYALRLLEQHPERVGYLLKERVFDVALLIDALRLLEQHPERVGYLLKERVFDVALLIDALRRLTDGETVIDPTIVSRLLARRRVADPLDELTAREREVLGLLAEGLSNRAIAARIVVTERTVEAHVKQIFLKLGLQTTPDTHRRVLAVLAYLRSDSVA